MEGFPFPCLLFRLPGGRTRVLPAHAGTRITRTNLTTNHPNPTTHPHDRATAETATVDSTAARTAAGPESTAPRTGTRYQNG